MQLNSHHFSNPNNAVSVDQLFLELCLRVISKETVLKFSQILVEPLECKGINIDFRPLAWTFPRVPDLVANVQFPFLPVSSVFLHL